MSNRPAIPAEIKREILLESGQRCAVCGTPCPLETAHIIPWHKSREHKAEDLICLCANCHERADKENWGEKTLREHKRMPWVLRQYKNVDSMPESAFRLEITIGMDSSERFDDKNQRWLQYGIAAFLEIPPQAVRIVAIEQGSVKVTIELPARSANRLMIAYQEHNPELLICLAPLILLDLRRKATVGERTCFTKFFGLGTSSKTESTLNVTDLRQERTSLSPSHEARFFYTQNRLNAPGVTPEKLGQANRIVTNLITRAEGTGSQKSAVLRTTRMQICNDLGKQPLEEDVTIVRQTIQRPGYSPHVRGKVVRILDTMGIAVGRTKD